MYPFRMFRILRNYWPIKSAYLVKLNLRDGHMKMYEQVVKPISSRDNFLLRYNEWELECRWKVDTCQQ